jgi:HSP20 family protein
MTIPDLNEVPMNIQKAPAKSEAKPMARRSEDIFDTMRREIDHIFDRWGNGGARFGAPFGLAVPDMDIRETDKEFVIEVELPGVDEKDVTCTLQNGILTLKGVKKSEREEKKDNYYLNERSFGSFERSVRLPETADEAQVDAKFANGVLKIAVQKRADAIKPERKIEIKKG